MVCLKPGYTQPGCTDIQANNYDTSATINDGSCTYDITTYALQDVVTLPGALAEISGIEHFESGLWAHNDAGNTDEIFRIDSLTGEILQTVIIATADNIDWEDFAEDEQYLYLGDFGNNNGNRMDLHIYKISKADLNMNVVNAEIIEFSYSDQVDFSENPNNNDFDCEAMIYHDGNLHLFSKNWLDNRTKHYILPTTPGEHTAMLVESFDVEGLITGADISENGAVVLVGYTEVSTTFMWLLFDYQNSDFFSGNKRKIALGTAFTDGQIEGVTFRASGYGYISSEAFSVGGQVFEVQKLSTFDISQWIDMTTSVSQFDLVHNIDLYPSPASNTLNVKLEYQTNMSYQIIDLQGRIFKEGEFNNLALSIDLDDLQNGWYLFRALGEEDIYQAPFFKIDN